MWRGSHDTLAEKRDSLCQAFNCETYSEQDIGCGIGGGYGQFGILTEEEFNAVVKGNSERVKRFTEHPDQWKEYYSKTLKVRYATPTEHKADSMRYCPADEDDWPELTFKKRSSIANQ
jgi:hypothetical protein